MKEEQVDKRTYKEIFPNARDIIKYAFTLNGVDYFAFDDFNNVPCERGFHALNFYNELSMRCTREFLVAHTTAIDNILNDNNGIKVTELVKLNTQLKERLEFIVEIEIAYKLCSVVFFTADENPYRFDYKYSLKKADEFRKSKLDDFFLQQPITTLLPSIDSSIQDLPTYLNTLTKINSHHLESISTKLSVADKNKEWFHTLMSPLQQEAV